jgi:hypothetical protein
MNLLPCNPFLPNFVFHPIHLMNVFYTMGNVLLYKKFEIYCMILCIPFDSFYKKIF